MNVKAICVKITEALRCGAIVDVVFGCCYIAGGIAAFVADKSDDVFFGVACLIPGVLAIALAVILWLYGNTDAVVDNTREKKAMAKKAIRMYFGII
mmetsp:Transcript_19268/g.23451  ORF Transcript_19268/g.23451 Transcript_19268/m.23451 type:complete len:96 (+) Transcript_19268:1-288(+)